MNQTLNDYVTRRTEDLSTALAVRPPEQAQRQALLVRGGATGVGALIAMTVLAASGAGGFAMFAMGGLLLWSVAQVRRASKMAPPPEPDPADSVFGTAVLGKTRADRIAHALATSSRPVTMEELGAYLKWTPDAVAHGLQTLVERGELIEDIDFDTGQWNYAVEDSAAARRGAPPSKPSLEAQIEEAWRQASEAGSLRELPTSVDAWETQREEQVEEEQVQAAEQRR